MSSILISLFGIAVLGIGGLSMKRAFTVRKRANLVEETPTEDVGSVSMGQSEVKGTARPTDEGTITAPFTDDEAIVAVWEVEEFSVTESDDGGSRKWRRMGNGADLVPFRVDDGTGQALVRPSEDAIYEIDESTEDPVYVANDQDPPPRVQTFLERDDWRGDDLQEEVWQLGGDDEDTSGYQDGDRRYTQHLIRPEEAVYVFGVAQPRDDVSSADNAANVVFEKVPEKDADLEDMFLISDKDEDDIIQEGDKAIKWYGMGIFMAMLGFGVLLFGIGVI